MKYITYIFLFLIATDCTGPNDARINPYDPASKVFAAMFSEPIIDLKPSRVIVLNWINESEYSDGFIIRKRLNDTFVPVDTIWNSTTFVDSSLQYSLNLKYKVTSLIKTENGFTKMLNRVTPDINYGEIQNVAIYPSQQSLIFQWSSGSYFEDMIILEYRENSSEAWKEIYKSVSGSDESYQRIELQLPTNQKYYFRMKLFIKNYKGEYQKFTEYQTTYN